MKKLLLSFAVSAISAISFGQTKSTGLLTAASNAIGMSANITLDNATSKVVIVLSGPSDRWFGIALGQQAGFGMGSGDALLYTTSFSDRTFGGTFVPTLDASQDWTVNSDIALGSTRTLTISRNLTNLDTSDYQLPYATSSSINIVFVKAGTQTTTAGGHGGLSNVGYATGTFTTLGVEDFSLKAASVYPNPTTGVFNVTSKTTLDKISVYSQVGAFIKTIDPIDTSNNIEVDLKGLQSGIYLIELQNGTDKSWKKIILE